MVRAAVAQVSRQERLLHASPLPAPPLAADPALLLPLQPPLPHASLPPPQRPKAQLARLRLLLPDRTPVPARGRRSSHSQQQHLMNHTKHLRNHH
jgi:hypothetical protein